MVRVISVSASLGGSVGLRAETEAFALKNFEEKLNDSSVEKVLAMAAPYISESEFRLVAVVEMKPPVEETKPSGKKGGK